nr:hypothetical protein [uncultured Cellulosilyticum sp.]
MFGLKFLLELNREDVTYDYLVRVLGVKSKGTIGNWISRGKVPQDMHIQRLAKELNVEPYFINRNLSKEEMEWLTYKRFQRKFERQYEETTIDYYDEEKHILFSGYPVVGQSDESKHEEEELWELEQDSSLKVEVLKFVNSFDTLDERDSARGILSQLIALVGNDEERVGLVRNLLFALENTLKEQPSLLGMTTDNKESAEAFNTLLTQKLRQIICSNKESAF